MSEMLKEIEKLYFLRLEQAVQEANTRGIGRIDHETIMYIVLLAIPINYWGWHLYRRKREWDVE